MYISGICSCQTRNSKISSKLEVSKKSRVKTFNTRLPLTPHIFQIHYHYKQQIFYKEFLIVLNIYYLISLNIF